MPWRSPPDSCSTRGIDADADAAKADRVEQDLLRDPLFLADVDEAEAVGDLPADEEVAPERLLLAERFVLIDGLDRHRVRKADRVMREVDFLVADKDPAGAGRDHPGQHFDQRGFAGAVVADQADDFVAANGQVDVAQSMHGAEIFLHAFHAHDVCEVRRTCFCRPQLRLDVRHRSSLRWSLVLPGREFVCHLSSGIGVQVNRLCLAARAGRARITGTWRRTRETGNVVAGNIDHGPQGRRGR